MAVISSFSGTRARKRSRSGIGATATVPRGSAAIGFELAEARQPSRPAARQDLDLGEAGETLVDEDEVAAVARPPGLESAVAGDLDAAAGDGEGHEIELGLTRVLAGVGEPAGRPARASRGSRASGPG